MRTYLACLVLLLLPAMANAQFQVCNSSTTKNLNDVHFVNVSTGIAVGDSGTILRSTDGGLNWTTVLSIYSITFSKVDFFDALNGIAVGSSVFTTADGGLNWVERIHGSVWADEFFDIAILNDSSCVVSGLSAAVLRSTDKGASWDTLVGQGPGGEFGNLSFVNDTLGFSCTAWGGLTTKILVTTNGGASWDTIVNQGNFTESVLEDMDFVDKQTGFQCGWYNGYFAKTTDGGQHWNDVHFTDSTTSGQMLDMDIHAGRPNAYYASGWYGTILKSIDGGDNWSSIPNPAGSSTNLYGIYFLNDTLGWVVGSHGIIMRTQNGGGINLGNNDVLKSAGISLFPNPVSNTLNINFENAMASPVNMQLIDMLGKMVMQKELSEKNNKISLDHIPQGQYLLRCTGKNNTASFKVFVK